MYEQNLALYIDGEWLGAEGRETRDIVNPANEEVIGKLPLATALDLDNALQSAEKALQSWRAVSPWERGGVLKRAAGIIRDRSDELARVMTLEQGKLLGESRGELERTIETFEWCGEEATRVYGRLYPQRQPGMRQATIRAPIGVVAAFSPWNFPAVLSARKMAAAIAAGCSIIIKPAEETPGVCIGIMKALVDAGLPRGVCNMVFGVPSEVSEHLLRSPIVAKVSLTGSTAVGKTLSRLAADTLKAVTMELGGHAPVIVFDDADPRKAAQMTATFKYRNAGQVCLAPSRLYVQQGIYDDFVEAYVEASKNMIVGDGMDPKSQMGPMANERRLAAMDSLVSDSVSRGAILHCGGQRIGNRGFYYAPTVLTGVPDDAEIMRMEPFGPISPITAFKDTEEVIARSNSLPFGLAAYAFTSSIERSTAVADGFEAGWIGINNFSPFLADAPGGGVKESGIGYEGGAEGLDAYLQMKFVSQTPG